MARPTDQDTTPLPDRRSQDVSVRSDQRGHEQRGRDRRRRNRVGTRLPGWLYVGDEVYEVDMQDVEDDKDHIMCPAGGAGFLSPSPVEVGTRVYLKIGIGPYRHPRAAKVVRCNRRPQGNYDVGVSFGSSTGASASSSGSVPSGSAA